MYGTSSNYELVGNSIMGVLMIVAKLFMVASLINETLPLRWAVKIDWYF